MNSINIWVKNGTDKSNLLNVTILKRLIGYIDDAKVLVHSNQIIKSLIKEEEDHDRFEVSNATGQTLGSMSTGERKRALLDYLLIQKPDVIVLDNPLDSLDIEGQDSLIERLTSIAHEVLLINIISRQQDALSFVNQNYCYQNHNLIAIDKLKSEIEVLPFSKSLPDPIQKIEIDADSLVSFKNVTIDYHGKPIITNINWEIYQNDFWQLIGPNGAGKTTILSMITGHNHKAYGQDIELFGFRKGQGESIWDIKKHIGYYTATLTHNYWRNQTVEQMIISGYVDSIGLYQKPSELQLEKAGQWLSLIGIIEQSQKPFIKLDQAHQRLVLIARAMVKHPSLLILDEPTADLDDDNVALVVSLINKFASESNTAIIFVSHREEKGLLALKTYELIPQEAGSIGVER